MVCEVIFKSFSVISNTSELFLQFSSAINHRSSCCKVACVVGWAVRTLNNFPSLNDLKELDMMTSGLSEAIASTRTFAFKNGRKY